MSDKHVRRSGSDYREAYFALLPEGQAWPKRIVGSVLWQTCDGLCGYWGDVDGRAADLLEIESDPRQTSEMLPDWERNWELPDPCDVNPPTDEPTRHDNLMFKMTLLGRQDRQFFIDFAARVGQTIQTIEEFAPYMCGVSRTGDTRGMYDQGDPYPDNPFFRWQLGAPEIRFYWTVDLAQVETGVECIFNRYKPMHTQVVFTYRTELNRNIGLYPWLGV